MLELGRRAFVGGGILLGCRRASASPPPYPVFDAFPKLATSLPRIALGHFPARIDHATALVPDGRLWIKRDDELSVLFGGGKVRKLELYFGDARAKGKTRLVTSGGTGSNQALAVALLGKALGFDVRLHLAPQPPSSLVKKNLSADAAAGAEMRLFDTVSEGDAQAARDAQKNGDTYVIPPGGTTPLGTLGFVSAGLEIAEDVRASRMPAPKRIYVALGLGGSAAGLGIGCALGGLKTEIVGVRASTPTTVTPERLRAIHDDTIAFARARDASIRAVRFDETNVRIDGRFVGGGYGVPTPAGDDAIARARANERWELDPVYTGKALAALLEDASKAPATDTVLFWNTMSSRPVGAAAVPAAFERWTR